MKEVMAIIRINMINQTKEALMKDGFPSINCRKVLGRGKKKLDFSLIEDLINEASEISPKIAEVISEGHRLIPKRLLSVVVKDSEVKRVINSILDVNSNGNPGDGKIFVLPILDVVRVRTGETGEMAL